MSKELDYIADLERENRLLGERCNQLLKDKGELTDRVADLEETNSKLREQLSLRYNLEDKIQQLEQQMEKIKCCENCKYNSYWGNELHCNYGLKEALQEDKLVECNKMDKWEIKENG